MISTGFEALTLSGVETLPKCRRRFSKVGMIGFEGNAEGLVDKHRESELLSLGDAGERQRGTDRWFPITPCLIDWPL